MISLLLSLIKIVFYAFVVLWGALSIFAFKNIKKNFLKYRNLPSIDSEQYKKWFGLIRMDFNCWN